MLRTFRYLHLKWICHVVTHTHTHRFFVFFLFLECVDPGARQPVSLCHRVALCGSSRGLGWSMHRLHPHMHDSVGQDGVCLTQLFASVSADKAFKNRNKCLTDGKRIVVSFLGRQVLKDFDLLFETTARSWISIFKLRKLSKCTLFGPEGHLSRTLRQKIKESCWGGRDACCSRKTCLK